MKTAAYLSIIAGTLITSEPIEWKTAKKENGLEVITGIISHSDVKYIKAFVDIEASPCQIGAAILDVEQYELWGYRCSESRLLKRLSTNQLAYYYISDVPWPASDRDLVSQMTLTKATPDEVIIDAHRLDIAFPEKKHMVRVLESAATWRITKIDARRSRASFNLRINPGGNVPSWIANLFLADGPYRTLLGLRTHALLDKYRMANTENMMP